MTARPPLYPVQGNVQLYISDPDDPTKPNLIDRWMDYTISLSAKAPCNSFSLTISPTPAQRKLVAKYGGQRVAVVSHGAIQMYGRTQEVSETANTNGTDLKVTGRNSTGLLVDAAVPLDKLDLSGLTMQRLVESWTAPYEPGDITSVVYSNEASRYTMAGALKKTGSVMIAPGIALVPSLLGPGAFGLAQNGMAAVAGVGFQRGASKTFRARGKFGKKNPAYRGVKSETLRNTKLEKGTTIMAAIQMLAEQIGQVVMSGADGSLVITEPAYNFDPSAYGGGIELRWDKKENKGFSSNVIDVSLETSTAERNSEYTVLSSVKSKKNDRGSSLYHTKSIKDPSPAFWGNRTGASSGWTSRLRKPTVINATGISSPKMVSRMARRTMLNNAIAGFSLKYTLAGHHSPSGALWVPDSMINVLDERNEIEAPMYIQDVERRFEAGGRTTALTLIPPDIWLGRFDQDTVSNQTFDKEMAKRIWW